jgi:DNA-binding transcriptional regulator LsrR (DeoR family)
LTDRAGSGGRRAEGLKVAGRPSGALRDQARNDLPRGPSSDPSVQAGSPIMSRWMDDVAKERRAQVPSAVNDPPEGQALGGRRSARLRLRAAWMYYVEEMTQNAVADALGIGRVTVVRLLSDARALHEVKISLRRDIAELAGLEMALQRRFGLTEAIVAPLSSGDADATAAIGAATGQFISDFITSNMIIGVGWGRTLLKTLSFIDEKPLSNVAVVSLLGGISAVRQYNPAEFGWQFSRAFGADCFQIAAPALVDSVETKQALVERCGIGAIFELANSLDAILISVGGMNLEATNYLFGHFSAEDRQSLLSRGAVGDILYNFFDKDGKLIDHPINERVMSVPMAKMINTPHRILTSGGAEKIDAILGAMRLIRPTVFVTDEATARALLARKGAESSVDLVS